MYNDSIALSEKDAKLAQKLGQLQAFIAAFPQECTGQPQCIFSANLTPLALVYTGRSEPDGRRGDRTLQHGTPSLPCVGPGGHGSLSGVQIDRSATALLDFPMERSGGPGAQQGVWSRAQARLVCNPNSLRALDAVGLGFGRIAALHHRASTLTQDSRRDSVFPFLRRQCSRTLGRLRGQEVPERLRAEQARGRPAAVLAHRLVRSATSHSRQA